MLHYRDHVSQVARVKLTPTLAREIEAEAHTMAPFALDVAHLLDGNSTLSAADRREMFGDYVAFFNDVDDDVEIFPAEDRHGHWLHDVKADKEFRYQRAPAHNPPPQPLLDYQKATAAGDGGGQDNNNMSHALQGRPRVVEEGSASAAAAATGTGTESADAAGTVDDDESLFGLAAGIEDLFPDAEKPSEA